MLLGSCFAAEIGARFREGRMPVMVNPFGVLYNPESVAESIRLAIDGTQFVESDLDYYNKRYLSFYHGTSFSGSELSSVLSGVNRSLAEMSEFLKQTRVLSVTFGTAWIYKWKQTGRVVSNCHKIPSSNFSRSLLSPENISHVWKELLEKLRTFNPELELVFTVSPVRHLKDGFHENQVSKSVLHLAIKDLMETDARTGYFPSYEIVLDELRDYRFYADDMIHPSAMAVDYIWEKFTGCYFAEETLDIFKKVSSVDRARSHRFMTDNESERSSFRQTMLSKISKLSADYPFIDFRDDIEYFKSI
jgi:hypothetical protein